MPPIFFSKEDKQWMTAYLISLALVFLVAIAVLDGVS
jgi:hypothetical protein